MPDNMKITMLGTTGAGKTCFMVGMYAVMQLGVHGFTLSAQDLDDDIDLTDNWERLVDGGEERFPAGTSKTHSYGFDFNYGFRKLMGFEWMDYRGGALRDKSTESDVQELEANLLKSSCVFLCISGEHLANKIESEAHALKLGKETRADRMNLFLNRLHEKRGPLPVVVAITKYDMCSHRKREEIAEDVKKIFSSLFTEDSNWLVTICPVSLGKALAGDKFAGNVEPVNLHLPLAFAIYSQLMQYAVHMKEQEGALNKKLTEFGKQNRLMKWINSDEISKANNDLAKSQAQMNELYSKLSLLANQLLGRAKVYFNGEEQEINV